MRELDYSYTLQKDLVIKEISRISILFALFIMFILSGCADVDGEKIKNLEKRIQTLDFRLSLMQDDYAFVSTDTDVYATCKTKFGTVILIAKEATPYLDGYKVRLAIGNITNATFSGAKVTVKWGEQEKDFELTTIFYPGNYSYFDVVLSPAKPEEIKTIRVKPLFNMISLRGGA